MSILKKFFHFRFLVVLFLLIILVSAPAFSALPPELQTSLTLLNDGKAQEALTLTENYLSLNPGNSFYAAAEIIAGRCELKLGNNSSAIEHANNAIKVDPAGGMAPQGYYLLATAYQERGDSFDAATALLNCLNLSPQATVATLAQAKLKEVIEGPAFYRVNNLKEQARSQIAENVLAGLTKSNNIPKIGIIVQEAEFDTVISEPLLLGAKTAAQIYQRDNNINVELVEKIIRPGSLDAILATRELVRQEGVVGLILGLPEAEAMAAAIEAQSAGVPVILPGHREPGLFAIGPSVVQPEADWYREGEISAIYAADSLKLETFVILAPATKQGRENVGGFTEALARRGGTEILALEWYFPEEGLSVDRQVRRIREIGFRRDFADSLKWWGLRVDSTEFEILWQAHLDSVRRSLPYKIGKIDSNAIAIKSIDALYVPIEPGTIELFAPQIAFYNFRAQKFGNAAWYDPTEIYRHRQYVEDMVITSPLFHRDSNLLISDLAVQVAKQNGGVPGIWNVRGFDAVWLIMNQITAGLNTPSTVADGLRHIDNIGLASGRQVFNNDRLCGLGMWLLTMHEGEVEKENVLHRRIVTRRPPLPPPPVLDTLDTGQLKLPQGLVLPLEGLDKDNDE